MQSGLQTPPLQTRSWHFTHAHTSSGCSPQIGSQTGHLARQLAALFVHAPHAVDKRREHTSRIWTRTLQLLSPGNCPLIWYRRYSVFLNLLIKSYIKKVKNNLPRVFRKNTLIWIYFTQVILSLRPISSKYTHTVSTQHMTLKSSEIIDHRWQNLSLLPAIPYL